MENVTDKAVGVPADFPVEKPASPDEGINLDDIPEIVDFSGFKRSPHLAEFRRRILAKGRYFTRSFDYASGTVRITEIDAATHEVVGSKVVKITDLQTSP